MPKTSEDTKRRWVDIKCLGYGCHSWLGQTEVDRPHVSRFHCRRGDCKLVNQVTVEEGGKVIIEKINVRNMRMESTSLIPIFRRRPVQNVG